MIHSTVEAEFLRELTGSIESFYGKEPKESPDYCRIVNDRNFERLEKLLKDAEVYYGGRTDPKERYIEPTVLRTASLDCAVMRDEIFGPILPVIQIGESDQAIDFVNSRPKPLALYLFSKSRSVKKRVLEETSSGGVCVNDVVMHMPSPYLPFGGVGPSGMGHYHGKRSFETFTHQKGVVSKSTWPDFSIRYAPYSESKLKWMRLLS